MNNYLIENEDSILIEQKEKEIINKNKFQNDQINIYDLEEESTIEDVLEDLDTYSFLSSKKVIIIRNIEVLKYDENKKSFDHLFKYLDNSSSDNLLIIEAKKLDNKSKISKELKKKCDFVKIEINSKSFIRQKLKDFNLPQETINLLDEYCLGDISKLDNECNKLINYKWNEKKITKEDIIKLVAKKEGDSKEVTFEFIKALASRDKSKALKLFKNLLKLDSDAIGIIGLLASQFRIMLQVKLLDERRMTAKEIAKMLDENEYRIKKTRELTPLYTEKEIRNLIIFLEEIDLQTKTTDTSAKNLLEMFIINM